MMILVAGSTGTNGRETVKQLSAAGHAVRALARSADQGAARSLADLPNVEIVTGDLDDVTSLESAFGGVDAAYLIPPNTPDQERQESDFIAAAKRSGVARLVKFSAMGAADDAPSVICRAHSRGERTLKESGMAWTILQPNLFMQNFLLMASDIAGEGVFRAPMGDERLAMVDTRDIAAVAVEALTSGVHDGKTYYLSGPQAISYDDAAADLSKVLNRPIRYEAISESAFKAGAVQAGLPAWLVDALAEIYTRIVPRYAAEVSSAVRSVTGVMPRTFDGFVRDETKAFTKAGR